MSDILEKPHKRGRPEKSNDEVCSKRIFIRLNGVDMTNLRRICHTDKKTKTEFIRDCIRERIYRLDYEQDNDNMYEDYFSDSYDEGNNEEYYQYPPKEDN